MRTLELAVVGTDSTHTADTVRLINQEGRIEGARVRQPVAELDDAPLGQVDGVLVLHRHGRDHVEPALAAIERGLPVFVDKPLAGTAADAALLLDNGRARGVSVTSRSAVRFSNDVAALRQLADDLVVSGPADIEGDAEEMLFYGIHVAELAHELVGPLTLEEVRREPGRVTARCRSTDRTVTLELLDRRGRGRAGFSLNDQPVRLHKDYLLPVLEHAVAVFRGAEPPAYDDLLGPVLLVERIAHELSTPDR